MMLTVALYDEVLAMFYAPFDVVCFYSRVLKIISILSSTLGSSMIKN